MLVYALVENAGKPDGIAISFGFILGIIAVSLAPVWRSTELRPTGSSSMTGPAASSPRPSPVALHIIANKRQAGDAREYALKEREQRDMNPPQPRRCCSRGHRAGPLDFSRLLEVRGVTIDGHRVLRTDSPVVPNALAAIPAVSADLSVCDHCYFEWPKATPSPTCCGTCFRQGRHRPVTREVLREVEKDPRQRPAIHVGG